MAVEEDIEDIPNPHLEFPVTTVAEVATLLENFASLIRLAILVERLVTSAENATKMTEDRYCPAGGNAADNDYTVCYRCNEK
ncbi:hypothetical protein NPIL_211871 [Nephila pilipes]|uniref:Uncharacterized protein n=1 Tax=Nephila pilipes TaxID=299642 RepID=A0A8X6UG88_NEPPI|nr:hypothetical protein NPIL_211871 [Nephila pilipes]